MDLVRCVNRNLLATTTQTPEIQSLMGNVQTLQFDCYDGTQWRNTWDTSAGDTNLPVAVRVRIQLAAKPGEACQQTAAAGNARPADLADAHQPDHRRDTMRLCENPEALRHWLRPDSSPGRQRGSVLVIVLWIAFGLVSLALYFANSMNFELRASDNRVSAMAADQAIEGAVRYLNYLLTSPDRQWLQRRLPDPGQLSVPGRPGRRGPLLADWPRHE